MSGFRSRRAFVWLVVSAFGGSAGAATITVGPGQTYTTIQDGVNAASAGDTIEVLAGTYNESVSVQTNNLKFVASGDVTIQGSGSTPAVAVGPDLSFSMDGFTIDGNNQHGIYHDGGPVCRVSITNCDFVDCDYGAHLSFGYLMNTFTFSNNTMTNCGTGLYAYGFDGATVVVSNNTAIDCGTGLDVEEFSEGVESDVTISDNTVTATTGFSGSYGIYCCCPERTTRFTGNKVTGSFSYGMYLEDVGCCGPAPAVLYIENNEISGCQYGLYFDELICCMPSEIYIRNNKITDNDVGINVDSVDYLPQSIVSITGNTIAGNTTWGFKNNSGEDLIANGNWWGDASGPSGEGPGTGDAISVNVIVESFLTSAPGSGGGSSGGCSAGAEGSTAMLTVLSLALLFARRAVRTSGADATI